MVYIAIHRGVPMCAFESEKAAVEFAEGVNDTASIYTDSDKCVVVPVGLDKSGYYEPLYRPTYEDAAVMQHG